MRDIDRERRDRVLAALEAASSEVSARRGVAIATELVNADPPTVCDPAILAALEALSVKDAAAAVAARTGLPRREVYGRTLQLAGERR